MARDEIVEYIKYQQCIQKKNSKVFNKEELQQIQPKSVKDIIDDPFYPSHLLLSIFSAVVYHEEVKESLLVGLDALKKKKGVTEKVIKVIEEIQEAKEWRLLAWAENPDDDYFGAAFWNAKQNQLVISHRGTIKKYKKRKTLITDLEGIIRHKYTSQIHSACTFSAFMMRDLDQTQVQISVTGHSLGAWLAQITTFTLEYLILKEEIFTGRDGSPRDAKSQIHAVVFDSPGCYEMLCQIAGHYYDKYEHEAYPLISALDITIFFNIPNRVNSVNSHRGIGRLLQIQESSEGHKDTTWRDLDSHKVTNFIGMLSNSDDINICTVLNWPSFEFPHALKKKTSGKPLKLSKSMTKVISVWYSARKIFKSTENELVNYNNCYNKIKMELGLDKEEDKVGGVFLSHKATEIDIKSRNASTFSEEQFEFLKNWKRVKDGKVAPDKFKNIQEILNRNKLDSFKNFLPSFEFCLGESHKKMIRSSSFQDLEKIIRRVKHLLAADPQAFFQMKKDADELLETYEAMYKSHSETYLKTLPGFDVDFLDIYELGEFLKSEEKVLALITKSETKYEVFRVRKLLRSCPQEQCYLSLTELDHIAQHLDLVQVYQEAKCRVDSVMILDCVAKEGIKIKEILRELIKTAKNSTSSKKIILVSNQRTKWLTEIVEQYDINQDEVEYSFLDFTPETKEKLFSTDIITLWNKKVKLAKFLNVTDSKESAQEQIDFLSHPNVLFSLLKGSYSNLELSSKNVIYHDNLKVLTVDLKKTVELKWLAEFFKAKPSDLEKIFGKPVLFFLTGISKTELGDYFAQDLTYVKFADDSAEFADFCRKNMYKRIYSIDFPNRNLSAIKMKKIFDTDFYIERRMQKQIIIDKEKLARFLKDYKEESVFFICTNISTKNFMEILNIKEAEIETEKVFANSEMLKISKNISVIITDEEEEHLFDNQIENTHSLKFEECHQKFIWKRSKGFLSALPTVRNLASFDRSLVLNELDLADLPDKLIIIAGESGVGKSTILLRYARKLTSSWVIWVKLVDFRKKFDYIDSETKLDDVVKFLLKCNENSLHPFTESLLKFNLTHKTQTPVEIFFDGYDEIVKEDIQNKILEIIIFLQKETNARIWITTKIWAKNLLEDVSSVFSVMIEEVNKNEQKKFIKNFWLAGSCPDINIKDFQKLLDSKAEELYFKSERCFFIERYLSSKDCLLHRRTWDMLADKRYDDKVLESLTMHINRLYDLVKIDREKYFDPHLESKIAKAILYLTLEENAHYRIKEFDDILNFVWSLDLARNVFSQRYLKQTYIEYQTSSNNGKDEMDKKLAKKKMAEIFLQILLPAYEDLAHNSELNEKFLATPLQLRMMGEILQKSGDSLATMQISEEIMQDHYKIYQEFISIKFNIHSEKKTKKEGGSSSKKKTLEERHQCLAIQLLFPDQYENILEDDEILDGDDETWKEDLIKMNQIGIIDFASNRFYFNHISFAEFFAANKIFSFLKRRNSTNSILEDLIMTDILLKEENIMIRKFLNGMLKSEPKAMFKFFEKKFLDSMINEMGESALHVCSSENLFYLAVALLNSFKEEILLQKFIGIKNIFYETALHYTAENNQVDLSTLILSHSPKENIIKFEATQIGHLFPEQEIPLAASVFFSFSKKDVIALLTDGPIGNVANIHEFLFSVSRFKKKNELSNSSLYVLLLLAIEHKFGILVMSIIKERQDCLAAWPISKILHHASKKGLSSIVTELLNKGADINTTECECRSTPLYIAAKYGHWDLVSLLIDLGAEIDICTPDEETVLYRAAQAGKLDIIIKLLDKGANINAIEKKGNYTPLTAAAAMKHWDVVLKLLEFGADPNVPEMESEMTALHFALSGIIPKEIVLKLIDAGANLDAIESKNNFTPMMSSAVKMRWDIVLELIKRGARVDVPTLRNKRTVLHVAAMHGAKEVVTALLEAGANINAVEQITGMVPIHLAAVNDKWDTVLELIRKGADVNIPVKDAVGNTALHLAATEGKSNVVTELLNHGADVNVINNFNWTSLSLAANSKHWDVVSILLKHDVIFDAVENVVEHLCQKAEEDGKLEWLTELFLLRLQEKIVDRLINDCL